MRGGGVYEGVKEGQFMKFKQLLMRVTRNTNTKTRNTNAKRLTFLTM